MRWLFLHSVILIPEKKYSDELAPERFYHGFVLGLMVEQRENYMIRSNRESGFGRYDYYADSASSKGRQSAAMVLEFKFYNEKIHHYGFAFKGKEVLIGE